MKFFLIFSISFALALADDASAVAPTGSPAATSAVAPAGSPAATSAVASDTLPNGLKHMKMIDMVDLHSRSKAFDDQVLLVVGDTAVTGDLNQLVIRFKSLKTSTELLHQQNGDASPLITLKTDMTTMKDNYMDKISGGDINKDNISSSIDAIKNLAKNIKVEVDKVLAVASVMLPNNLKRLSTTEISALNSHSQDFDEQLRWVEDNINKVDQAGLEELALQFGDLRTSTTLLCQKDVNCATLRTLYTEMDTMDNDYIKQINAGNITAANIADYIGEMYDLGGTIKGEVDKALAFYTLPNGLKRMQMSEISALRSHSKAFGDEMNAAVLMVNQTGSITQDALDNLVHVYNAFSTSADPLEQAAATETLKNDMGTMVTYLEDVEVANIADFIGAMKTLADNIKSEVDKILGQNIKEPSNSTEAAAVTTTTESNVQRDQEDVAETPAAGGTRLLGFLE